MNRYTLSGIAAFATTCLATGSQAQQGPPGGLNVNVLNTPLAVTGSTTVSGAVAATQSGAWSVNVANPAALAAANAQVLGMGTPVAFPLDPFHKTYSVQTGQRLVIEYISGTCPSHPGDPGTIPFYGLLASQITVTTNGVSNAHFVARPINPIPISISGFGFSSLVIGESVKIYADPGTNVTVPGDSDGCFMTLSGRLVAP